MPSYSNSLLLALAASAAQAIPQPVVPRSDEGIQWGECDIETEGLPVECAKLPVPLDYTDDSCEEKLDLALIRYPAQKGPSKGSILLNFGGPGQDGLNNMISYAPLQGPATGDQFDLISWDPRGTGQTLRFACFDPEELGTQYAQGNPDESPEAAQQVWDEAGIIAGNCSERLSETGDLVGMAFVARDMMQIVDALGEDGKLRYWGVSGGTALGATAAALFPDRMDKVILDGVMNSHEYYHKAGETNILISADDTLEAFVDACFDNPTKCPLASVADSPEAALEAIVDLFEAVKTEPILYPVEGQDPVPLTFSVINTSVLSLLYRPNQYQFLSIILTALITGDLEGLDAAFGGGDGEGSEVEAIPQEAEAIMGIRCGDKIPRADELSDLDELEAEFLETSKYFPGFGRGYYVYACAQWPFEAKERYEGDFQVSTANPLLFIGNTYDPVTPLASAKNMSAGFEGSALLHHDGFGHTSLAQESDCTNEIIAKYFLDGTLPEDGTVCEPNDPLFANDEEIPADSEGAGDESGEAPTSTEEAEAEESPADTEEAE